MATQADVKTETLLAQRCEQAPGPDRDIDALIAPLMGLRVVNQGHPLGRCCYDKRRRVVTLPAYTASIDAAITLVPEGWYWRAGHGVLWPGWAHLNRKHPDNCDRGDEHSAHAETPALALCAAALRARAA